MDTWWQVLSADTHDRRQRSRAIWLAIIVFVAWFVAWMIAGLELFILIAPSMPEYHLVYFDHASSVAFRNGDRYLTAILASGFASSFCLSLLVFRYLKRRPRKL